MPGAQEKTRYVLDSEFFNAGKGLAEGMGIHSISTQSGLSAVCLP